MTTTWKDKALAATAGTQTGAILACALSRPRTAPMFNGKASVTSDGFLMCDFTDTAGQTHFGAFVGAASDLYRNIASLANHLKLDENEHDELRAAINGWITADYRRIT